MKHKVESQLVWIVVNCETGEPLINTCGPKRQTAIARFNYGAKPWWAKTYKQERRVGNFAACKFTEVR